MRGAKQTVTGLDFSVGHGAVGLNREAEDNGAADTHAAREFWIRWQNSREDIAVCASDGELRRCTEEEGTKERDEGVTREASDMK